MLLGRLTWIFGGLFLVFGLPIVLTESETWQRVWAGLSTLSLGGFALAMAGHALVTGQIRIQFSVVRRAQRPWLFWAAVVLVAGAGVGVLITAPMFMFSKT